MNNNRIDLLSRLRDTLSQDGSDSGAIYLTEEHRKLLEEVMLALNVKTHPITVAPKHDKAAEREAEVYIAQKTSKDPATPLGPLCTCPQNELQCPIHYLAWKKQLDSCTCTIESALGGTRDCPVHGWKG